MIEFKGEITGECKENFIKNYYKGHILTTIFVGLVLTLFLLGALLIFKEFYIVFLVFIILVWVFTFILAFPKIKYLSKNIEANMPIRISITDDMVIKETKENYNERYIRDLKKVFDYKGWYEIEFYFPYKCAYCICQKDLITEGTIEEFEKLFEDKILRKF